VMPMLTLALLVDGFGELVGYVSGPGDAARVLGAIEFDRARFMDDADRRDFAAALAELDSPERLDESPVQAMAG